MAPVSRESIDCINLHPLSLPGSRISASKEQLLKRSISHSATRKPCASMHTKTRKPKGYELIFYLIMIPPFSVESVFSCDKKEKVFPPKYLPHWITLGRFLSLRNSLFKRFRESTLTCSPTPTRGVFPVLDLLLKCTEILEEAD